MVQGGTGLIQTPTSRMRPEGDFDINYTDNEEYRFWSVSLQLFPWMEATARYTDVRSKLYSDVESFSGDQTLKDKGLDVKFRLLEESFYLPEVSLGFRDFGGTGFFESEHITASKAYGPFDFHFGLGWGYLGTANDITNPFCKLKDSYCSRPAGYSGRGGKVDYQQFFKGTTSIFGGIEYQTPWEPLRLKLEFEGNDYSRDRAGKLEQDTRWNVGAVYKWDNFDFSLNYQRGNTLGFGVTYKFNMHTFRQTKIEEPPRSLINVERPQTVADINHQRLYRDLATESGFVLSDAHIDDEAATFYGQQIAFRDTDMASESIGRVIASEVPETIKTYHVVENTGRIPMVDTVIDADKFLSAARYEGLESDITSTYHRETPNSEVLANYEPNSPRGFGFSTDFFWTQTFGSPEDFYLYQGGLIFSGGYTLNKNVGFYGSIRATVIDNFDKFNFKVDKEDSTLPRVRTYVREYVTRSNIIMDTVYAQWVDKLSDNVYAQAYAGYLETMYGGVGTEVIYRPVDSRLAFGVDLNYVQQRSYENDFDFFDYKVLTGHASVYWRPEFLPDTLLTVSAGQFLAKDKGVNIDFAKRFDSGIVVGAYAAITDVSSEEYGEGSFTKGFYISVPLDLFVVKHAKGRGRFPWIPIARDGGQMLNRPMRMIDYTEARSPFFD
ncbi:YjbH domain-containing protein [Alteromonas pelagimontana]|uniref:YjbH domain-containing protein n=2 Tax=Alteromonas pelagimontana TaxID=1858656 RepID=A0A6M4MID7_9ALTE|nr:YjbH domain-containing protein [Alteromonas pelagimontana]